MTAFEPINVPQVAKLRVSDFLALHEAGAFERYAKSELIEGEIWVMNAIYSAHARIQFELGFQLRLALQAAGVEATIYTASSVEMSDDSLPEPDLIVGKFKRDGILTLAEAMLLVEVSDSTLKIDLGRKAELYARFGVPEYWVADIAGKRIVRMWQPGLGGYAKREETAFGASIESATLAGIMVDTRGI